MSEEEDSYCRLCAEPTPQTQLIAPDDDAGLNSKIATKMLWINVDVSTTNILPNSICFSCFDLLERTWSFLHNVRAAQVKLNEIFLNKVEPGVSSPDVKTDPENTGKPENVDWEVFETPEQDIKPDLLNEHLQLLAVDPNPLIDSVVVKTERDTDDDDDNYRPESDGFNTSDGFNSSDSDVPLNRANKKKKIIRNKKLDNDCKVSNSILNDAKDSMPLTWEDYICVCGECGAHCENLMSLRLHSLQIHTQCFIFKCPECAKVTTNYKSFLSHVRGHKKTLRYCCEYCNRQFPGYSHLKSHRNHSHSDVISTTCRYCGATFENSDLLQDHYTKYSKSSWRRVKPTKPELNNKIKIDNKCELCNKEFKTRGNLITHKLVHTERKRNFSCHVCGKMFYTKGSLSAHISLHDDTKPFKCEFCPLTFKARGNLIAHVSLHSGLKPFVCEQCGKSFRSKRHLKSHSIVHTDLRPYVCDYCKKTFRFKTRLNLHLRQHTGAKPYKCEYCQREFTNGSNYKKHMKRKHNIDTSIRKKFNVIVTSERLQGLAVK